MITQLAVIVEHPRDCEYPIVSLRDVPDFSSGTGEAISFGLNGLLSSGSRFIEGQEEIASSLAPEKIGEQVPRNDNLGLLFHAYKDDQ